MNEELLYIESYELSKLFCSFAPKDKLPEVLAEIQRKYTILYNKIFVFESEGFSEYICTYNIDTANISQDHVLENTILIHRNKATNTLYTINSLNALIAKLNGGVVDHSFTVNWEDYRNSLLLIRDGNFTQINIKIKDIINIS